MRFTPQEYADMLVSYGLAGENASEAARIYAERFPGRARHPTRRTILRVLRNFRETGCLVHSTRFAQARRCVEYCDEERILDMFDENPQLSIRRVARQLNLSRHAVEITLHENGLHPFHYQRVQQLLPRDLEPRICFCEGFLAQCRRNISFPDIILWTDEATFTPNGVFNRRNFLYWSDENPHVVREGAFQYRWSINVWAGVIGNQVIGPYFLPPRLTGNIYIDFLQNELPALLENVPLRVRRQLIFQHDGAPAHYCLRVREVLDARFPDRWIGRGGPIHWPARSPDLNVLDFFIWGHIKNLVENQRNGTENEAREAIVAAFDTITPDMVYRATRDVIRRAEFCVREEGRHFEQLLH